MVPHLGRGMVIPGALVVLLGAGVVTSRGATYRRCWLKEGECLDSNQGPLRQVREIMILF